MLKIAHRGAKLEATENSLAAFDKAIKMGVDMVELDVHQTKDGHLVVIHDPWIDRVTNGKGYVREMTLGELKQYKTQESESIPTLEEVYELCKGKVQVLTEIKTIDIGKNLAELIERMRCHEEVVVQSFLHGELKRFREYDLKTRTALLFDELLFDPPTLTGYAASLQCNGVVMPFKSIREDLVDAMHNQDYFVYSWGGESDELKKVGVDGHVFAL